MKKVLILTYEEDPHSKSVRKYFEGIGVDFFEVYTDKLIDRYKITFNTSKRQFILSDSDHTIILNEDWNIWNRRVMDSELPESIPKNLQDIVFTETKRTWEGLLFSHEGRVINRPQANFSANNKIDQLIFASRYGNDISIPETILTNDAEVFYYFYKNHERVSFKLQKSALVKKDDEFLTTYNNIVTEKQAENASLIKINPSLFQEYIEKEYEIRITVLEDKVIGIKIDSQNSKLSAVDYRRYDFENVSYTHIDLPKNVEKFCTDLIKHYGLAFGEIDMIYSKSGRYVFLELNPNGQWLWLELKSGYNLTKDVAENLI